MPDDNLEEIAILNSDKRLFRAWASIPIRDTQGEVIPIELFKKVFPALQDRIIPLHVEDESGHTNNVVGEVTNIEFKEHPKYGEGLLITGKIYDHFTLDNATWEGIKKGVYKGLSVGGMGKVREDGVFEWIEPCEFTITRKPANWASEMVAVSMAKTDNNIKIEKAIDFKVGDRVFHEDYGEGVVIRTYATTGGTYIHRMVTVKFDSGYIAELQATSLGRIVGKSEEKPEEAKPVQKPFAGYKDFEDCVNKNKDKDNPEAYCGYLKNKFEKIEQVQKSLVEKALKPEDKMAIISIIEGLIIEEGLPINVAREEIIKLFGSSPEVLALFDETARKLTKTEKENQKMETNINIHAEKTSGSPMAEEVKEKKPEEIKDEKVEVSKQEEAPAPQPQTPPQSKTIDEVYEICSKILELLTASEKPKAEEPKAEQAEAKTEKTEEVKKVEQKPIEKTAQTAETQRPPTQPAFTPIEEEASPVKIAKGEAFVDFGKIFKELKR